MPTLITCPNCQKEFAPEDAIAKTIQKEYDQKYRDEHDKMQQQFDIREKELAQKKIEFEKKKEMQNSLFAERMEKEKIKMEEEVNERLTKKISNNYENQLRMLAEANKDHEEKLRLARHKELTYLKKENDLKIKEEELELSLQRKLSEERALLADQIRKQERDKNELKETDLMLKIKERDKQIEDQKKLVDEMKRKAEQQSMQLQGEVQEIALEDILRNTFPFDVISEVGKGSRGADCIQTVRNNFGQECGSIIYESKRTENFGNDWIEKFKKDMRSSGADIAVLVTRTMPKEMECFGAKEDIWVCTFSEVKALAHVLRDGILRVYNSSKKHENKGDKMNHLYDYLTSNEFHQQWKAIREGFLAMHGSIQTERNAMEKLWKAREKQLEKIFLNSAHISGSIEGIAGMNIIDMSLPGDEERLELNI